MFFPRFYNGRDLSSHLNVLGQFFPSLLLSLPFLMKNDIVNIFMDICIHKYTPGYLIFKASHCISSSNYGSHFSSFSFTAYFLIKSIFLLPIFSFMYSKCVSVLFILLQLLLSKSQIISMFPKSMVISLSWQHFHPHLENSTLVKTCYQPLWT